jgi:hypothetical protein
VPALNEGHLPVFILNNWTAFEIVEQSALALAIFDSSIWLKIRGTKIPAKMAIIPATTITSIRVKPF